MPMGNIVDDFRLALGGKEYVPIMIGGMGVDISTAALALEACRLGGIGHISDAMSQFVSDKKFGTRYTKAKGDRNAATRDGIDKTGVKFIPEELYEAQHRFVADAMARKKGPGAVFVNVMEKLTMAAPLDTLAVRLRAALDAGIDGMTLSAGLHMHSLGLIENHPRFRDCMIGPIVSSARALKIFLRSARRVSRMPDYIVVEGPLAGGHLGFGDDWREHRLHDIVVDVMKLLEAESLDIPVIPAGGVFTGTDAVEFLRAGAGAVQVATRFTISHEAGLPMRAKQRYLSATEQDVIVSTLSPTGYPIRLIKDSPCVGSNIKPQCEPFGYVLGKDADCAYLNAWEATPIGPDGEKLPVRDKICLCYHFSKHNCYTCGHYVYRLKDTTHRLPDGSYQLLSAEHVFRDYQFSRDHQIALPASMADMELEAAAT